MSQNNNPRVPPIGGPSPSFYQQNKGDIWSLIGAGVTWGKDAWQNKKNKQLEAQRRKYDQEQWERQNRYNHPIEQMARLKQAGLNPNMIYGSSPGSAVGNAGAIPAGQAPDYSLTNPVTGFMNTKVQQAQTNNIKSASNLNIVKSMEGIAKTKLTNVQQRNQTNLLAGNLELQEQDIKQKTALAIQEVLKAKAMSNEDKGLIARYTAETQTAFENRDLAKYKKEVEKLNATLSKNGIRPTDSIYVRIMSVVTGIDLSKPLSKDQRDQLETFINNPFKKLN